MAACNALERDTEREAAKFSHRLQRNANAVHTHQCARGGQHHRRGRFAVNCRRAIIMCVHLYDLALVDRPLPSHRSPMRKSQQRSISFHPVVGHNTVPRYLLCCSAIGRAAPRNSAVIASVFSSLPLMSPPLLLFPYPPTQFCTSEQAAKWYTWRNIIYALKIVVCPLPLVKGCPLPRA